MKKRRMIIILLSFAFVVLLAASIRIFIFSRDTFTDVSDTDVRYSDNMRGYAVDDGYYYLEQGFVKFFDYQSKTTVKVCNKPNCIHSEWSEETPLEERCNAYLDRPMFVSFFAHGQHLYFFISGISQKTVLYQSDLQRGDTKELLTLDAEFVGDIYLKGNSAFFSTNVSQMDKDESGMPVQTGISTSRMHALNLETMTIRDLIPPQYNYSGQMSLYGISGDRIVYNYLFFVDRFYGDNFDGAMPHNDLFSYDLNTGEIHQELENVWSNDAGNCFITDSDIYFSVFTDRETASCDLFRCSLETGEAEQIAGGLLLTGFYDGKLFYETRPRPNYEMSDGQDNAASPYRYFDISTGQENECPCEYFVYDELNDGFIVAKVNKEGYASTLTLGFIKKTDYYVGRIEKVTYFD